VFNYSLHFMHPSIDKYNSFIYSMRRVLVKLKLSLEMQSLSEQSTINIGLHCKWDVLRKTKIPLYDVHKAL
jgi:hypothetical protein